MDLTEGPGYKGGRALRDQRRKERDAARRAAFVEASRRERLDSDWTRALREDRLRSGRP